MKYSKKPVTIEAFKWTGGPDHEEDPAWIVEAIKKEEVWFENIGSPDVQCCIKTLEGTMTASVGDYIIQGVKGEIYPCKPDIFVATYDPADNNKHTVNIQVDGSDIERLSEAIKESLEKSNCMI